MSVSAYHKYRKPQLKRGQKVFVVYESVVQLGSHTVEPGTVVEVRFSHVTNTWTARIADPLGSRYTITARVVFAARQEAERFCALRVLESH